MKEAEVPTLMSDPFESRQRNLEPNIGASLATRKHLYSDTLLIVHVHVRADKQLTDA